MYYVNLATFHDHNKTFLLFYPGGITAVMGMSEMGILLHKHLKIWLSNYPTMHCTDLDTAIKDHKDPLVADVGDEAFTLDVSLAVVVAGDDC